MGFEGIAPASPRWIGAAGKRDEARHGPGAGYLSNIMPHPKIALLFLLLATGGLAQTDPAAIERQQKDLERRESRELQKVDQAQEQERIKLRARERDELARIQRDINTTALTSTTAVVATGSLASVNTAKLADYKLAQDEFANLLHNQLEPEMDGRFNHDRKAINRKYALERAKLEAQQIPAGDDAAKQRDQAGKLAGVADKYQEPLDNLDLEQEAEAAKLRFSHTTKINTAERDLAAMISKHIMDQAGKGAAAAAYNPAVDPEFNKLSAVRDEAKNALQTALDELRAKLEVRRTDINNALEDEKAKITGG